MTYTAREFYLSVIEKLGADSVEGAYAQAKIDKMDEKLAARKATQTVAQKEAAELTKHIVSTFETGVGYTAAQVGAEFGISVQKASSILRMAAKDGVLTQADLKVKACKAQGIKGGTVKQYFLKGESEADAEG